jgi:uncharacterized protein YdhG (YjbR/CyaY superfamily)
MSAIDDYLQALDPQQKAELERIRKIAKTLVPDAEESISYDMPALKYKGKPLIYFAAFKNHMSIFPTPGPIETMSAELAAYKTSRGTLQFTVDNPIPEALLKELITARLQRIG